MMAPGGPEVALSVIPREFEKKKKNFDSQARTRPWLVFSLPIPRESLTRSAMSALRFPNH